MNFAVYTTRLIPTGDSHRVEMVLVATVDAPTPEAALRAAKADGIVAPIVGPMQGTIQ